MSNVAQRVGSACPGLTVYGSMVPVRVQPFFAGMILEVLAAKDKRDFEYRLSAASAKKREKASGNE